MDRALFGEIRALLKPLERKLKLVASKAVLELLKDSSGLQQVQVSLLAGEASDGTVEHMQPGGLTHVPLPGAEGVYLTIGGVRDDGVVLALSNRGNRPTGLLAGETSVYSSGALPITIKLKIDGTLEIEAPLKVTVKAPTVELSASGAPGEPSLNGDSHYLYIDAINTAIAAAINGIPGSGPGLAVTFGNAVTLANGTLKEAALSTVIKVE